MPADPFATAPGPASVLSSAVITDMAGVYADPRVAPTVSAALSQKTLDILNRIQSLISNELETVGASFREMVAVDLELEPDEALPEETTIRDLTDAQRRALSEDTHDAGWLEIKFGLTARLASLDAEQLGGVRAFMFGEQYVGMSEEELADARINQMVDAQISMIRNTMGMAREEAFQRYAATTETPTALGDPLSDADFDAMRADLLAKRRDEFQRGELRLQVEVFASVHAANYEKTYATLDTADAGLVVKPENGVAFDEGWVMSERDKQFYGRMFEGITVVDGELVLDEEKANFMTEMGLGFLEKHGEIGLEYLRDARA
ncbi:hypothetical protein [uncultured Roseobacter sp.]|uniref:hypothetical protein n=1 Tax=uncultured Roseobacter sp. TaxID=114847 RepID=UPI00262C0F87|nr:hypothetical protein [uncultured Roseobacter sp.]